MQESKLNYCWILKQKFFLIWQNNLKIDFKFFVYETHKSVVKQLQIFYFWKNKQFSRNPNDFLIQSLSQTLLYFNIYSLVELLA